MYCNSPHFLLDSKVLLSGNPIKILNRRALHCVGSMQAASAHTTGVVMLVWS